jgi:hypothetical protein
MTKTVRIENADTSSYKVIVEVWQQSHSHPADAPPVAPVLIATHELGHPTALLTDYLTSDRFLLVKEG